MSFFVIPLHELIFKTNAPRSMQLLTLSSCCLYREIDFMNVHCHTEAPLNTCTAKCDANFFKIDRKSVKTHLTRAFQTGRES